MLEGFYAAAAGMNAQQRANDSLANDMANLQTPGYKSVRVRFHDLLYQPNGGVRTGSGAAADVTGRSWGQGTPQGTGRSLDLALAGPGFFEVRQPNGAVALTRNGTFELDARGRLTTSTGDLVLPGVTLPPGSGETDFRVASNGNVTVRGKPVGRVRITDVPNPDGLRPIGDGLFVATAASGAPRAAVGTEIRQGELEASNADFLELVGGQRAFQFLSRVIKQQDEMLAIANKLKE